MPLTAATYVIVSSAETQRSVTGDIPPFACVVDEAWLLNSFMEGALQNVREYFVDPLPHSRKRKSSSLSVLKEPRQSASRSSSEDSELSEPLLVQSKLTPTPHPQPQPSAGSKTGSSKGSSKAVKGKDAERDADPDADAVDVDWEVMDVDPGLTNNDDSDDESYCTSTSADERDVDVEVVAPSEADMTNVWWLIDELRIWDKKGAIRDILQQCSKKGVPNPRKLYYSYKPFIEKRVPDLRVRRPYTKRVKTS